MGGRKKLQQEIFNLGIRARIDPRTVACSVDSEINGKSVKISGFSQFPQTDAFIRNQAAEVFSELDITFDLKILSRSRPKFHQVTSSFVPFWKHPDDSKPEQLVTQALAGAVVRTYFPSGKYLYAQSTDGYLGYVPKSGLIPADENLYLRWKNGPCAILNNKIETGGMLLAPGTRLIFEKGRVVLPGGNSFRASGDQIRISRPADPAYFRAVAALAKQFEGTPYLWGGKTEAGIDCSGFVQTMALQMGILLPRDASMQANVGEYLGYLPDYADLLPGDLMFFMNDKAYVFHVGIYAGKGRYLHSSGKLGVAYSDVAPGGKNYSDRYGGTFVFARRVHS
jgi:hypothetical protein